MVTINLSIDTKERFKKLKLELSGKQRKCISEDKLEIILLDKYEGKKR